MSEDMKKLKQAFKEGIIVPGRHANGTLSLRGHRNPEFQPLELEEFLVSAFEEQGATIDPDTLKFVIARKAKPSIPVADLIQEAREILYGTHKENETKIPKKVKLPKEEKKNKDEGELPTPQPIPDPTPNIAEPELPIETFTRNELEEMPWQDLRAMAKDYKECEGLTKKAEFIEALVGIKKI